MTDAAKLRDLLRVKPGSRVKLSDHDPAATFGWNKEAAVTEMTKVDTRLTDLQDKMWAGAKGSVLVVLQGIDASGKDGTVSRVLTAFNPQGCTVAPFKVPTAEEAAHDFLWRIHKRTPGKGEIAIFNRSHYEQVLVVRVHKLEPRSVWSRHYDQINEFEELLTESGTKVVKFFLHLSKEEQRKRFLARIDTPEKNWKFNEGDVEERKRWTDYMHAYEQAMSATSSKQAPWYIVPADDKENARLIVSDLIVKTLEGLKISFPPVSAARRRELQAIRGRLVRKAR